MAEQVKEEIKRERETIEDKLVGKERQEKKVKMNKLLREWKRRKK